MSINPELHEDVAPYLVSPYENFFFLIQRVKLTVESGGYGVCPHCCCCYVSLYC